MSSLPPIFEGFHPPIITWFERTFHTATLPQEQAWPAIKAGRHTLIAAPTGSGKTLAAFLAAIDDLIQQGISAPLPDATQIVYVSPLKALSNDIKCNLEAPLVGIRAALQARGDPDVEISVWVRTGDTPAAERARVRKRPPHIIVTTPESLYILLTSESGRRMLSTTRTVIVDEIHALAANKRGSHLALTLARLEALNSRAIQRIGLSATQRPIAEIARYLVGNTHINEKGDPDCIIIDSGHTRPRDLALELPGAPLEAVMSGEVWEQIYDRIAALIAEHRTTLVFANTRRMAERVARHLSERIGDAHVSSHHGSLSREQRLNAESRLKKGELKALVATASLELGIDIGDVDLVCQLSSPRSISTFLQRVGRAGHAVGGTSKGRLFPLTRDDLVECAALIDAVARGELDRLTIPAQPLDVLSQQIVAELANREWTEDGLYELVLRAYPYRALARKDFDEIVHVLAEGYSTERGRRSAHIYRDAINKRLSARRGTRLTAITNGGTIPDNADFDVLLEPENLVIGTLNEDFAIESLQGDIFQLGNRSYRILRVEASRVRVEDARGQPPNIPFWLGEAPARSAEFSCAVSRLYDAFSAQLESNQTPEQVQAWLRDAMGLSSAAARQIYEYLAASHAALGALPTLQTIVLERFFDESGGMQLVIHSPCGSRINRAWGLALRKRFCRKFNFELQAAATEDAIVLSLTTAHSFPLEEVASYLHSATARQVLIQALLDAPLFTARWRWNATIALAIPRFRGGKKVPPNLQRMLAEDLVSLVFPGQRACLENIVGEREVPDHPLVRQTLHDCLYEAMDVEGMEALLRGIEAGDIRIVARDLTEPSPLAHEILNAQPYAFLDDAPLEERRTHAVQARRWLDPKSAADLGKLDSAAIARVREEVWPVAESADELHEAVLLLGFMCDAEMAQFDVNLRDALLMGKRISRLYAQPNVPPLWIAAERLAQCKAIFPDARLAPPLTIPEEYAGQGWTPETAMVEVIRSRLEALGPATAMALARALGISMGGVEAALATLEVEGSVLRGQFTQQTEELEWCERRLLARIHRYTLNRLRQEIEPVPAVDFMRFLLQWQRVTPEHRAQGADALAAVIDQLAGFQAAAVAWEGDLFPARLADYDPAWLDALCLSGRVKWARLSPSTNNMNGPVRSTPIALINRKHFNVWRESIQKNTTVGDNFTSAARTVGACLSQRGAMFFDELVEETGLLRTHIEEALGELVASGLISADGFSGLRALLIPSAKRRPFVLNKRRHRLPLFGIEDAGRWAWLDGVKPIPATQSSENMVHIANTLLRRYGVVFRRLIEREADTLPPWRELLWVYRAQEARGEIRGGRFVAGFSGEQYALPDAIGVLRSVRRQAKTGEWVALCGADPLNLAGIITPGQKIPALQSNRVLYRDGLPVAAYVGREIIFLQTLQDADQEQARDKLLRRANAGLLNLYLHR